MAHNKKEKVQKLLVRSRRSNKLHRLHRRIKRLFQTSRWLEFFHKAAALLTDHAYGKNQLIINFSKPLI